MLTDEEMDAMSADLWENELLDKRDRLFNEDGMEIFEWLASLSDSDLEILSKAIKRRAEQKASA